MLSLKVAPLMEVMKSAWEGLERQVRSVILAYPFRRQRSADIEPAFLALGDDENGRGWILDFDTGEVKKADFYTPVVIAPTNNLPLMMSALTPERLVTILRGAGYGAQLLGEDVCVVQTEIGHVEMALNAKLGILRMCRRYTSPNWDEVKPGKQARIIEWMNRNAIIPRFTLDRMDGEVQAEYELPAIAGLSPAQVLAALRAFVSETTVLMRVSPGLNLI